MTRKDPLAIDAAGLHRVAAILAAGVIAIVALMYAIWHVAIAPEEARSPLTAIPPMPRLEAEPAKERGDTDAKDRDDGNRYAWNDAEHRSATIPIERAMRILVERASHKVPSKPEETKR